MQERTGQIGDYWLSKRPGSEQWCRTWYDERSRQTCRASIGTSDLQEAKLALYAWYAKNGRIGQQSPQDAPLELFLARYYQQHAQDLPSAEMARVALGYWSDFYAGLTVAELRPAKQREFHDWLRERRQKSGKPLSEGYIKRIIGVGASALVRAYKEGELESVPFILPGKDAPPKDRVLSLAESCGLWLAADYPHERMFLALAFGTLSRPEAILDLTREMVDFDRRLIATNPPGRVQTKKYRPVVPVPAFLLPWLEAAPKGPLVAWHGKGIDSFKTSFRRMRRRAVLGQEVVAKTIRHTMATELRSAGVPEAEIQGMLGHRAYSGKTEIYAKYRPDYLGLASQAIDGYMMGLRSSCVLVHS